MDFFCLCGNHQPGYIWCLIKTYAPLKNYSSKLFSTKMTIKKNLQHNEECFLQGEKENEAESQIWLDKKKIQWNEKKNTIRLKVVGKLQRNGIRFGQFTANLEKNGSKIHTNLFDHCDLEHFKYAVCERVSALPAICGRNYWLFVSIVYNKIISRSKRKTTKYREMLSRLLPIWMSLFIFINALDRGRFEMVRWD